MNKKSIPVLFLAAFFLLLVSCVGGEQATDSSLVETKPAPSNQIPPTDPDVDLRFKDAVTQYVQVNWGKWAIGESMGQCLIARAESITEEAKEAVIEHGIDRAFDKLSGVHLRSLGFAWDLCEATAGKPSTAPSEKPQDGDPPMRATLDFESATVYADFSESIQAQFKNVVDEHFDAATEKAGISAAVYQESQPNQNSYLWRYAKGKASSLAEMTVGTPILIRSTSKVFLAGLVLQQIDEGLYSLSDTLSSVLSDSDEYTLLNKDVINPDVTVEQLLNMTSGIKHVQDFYRQEISNLQGGINWSPIDAVGLVILDFVSPGTYNYSNTNTMLLGLIAEHKGGQTLNELYKSELLDPLDLVALLLPQDGAPPNTAHPHDDLALYGSGGTGFGDISEVSYFADWYQADGKIAWAAAGIITTPENMARWAFELFSEHGSGISSTARTRLMNSFVGPLVEVGPKKQQYGYHAAKMTLELTDSAVTVYGHPGSGAGFVSDVYYSPELGMSISLVINSHSNARTRAEAQGKITHKDLDEIARKIFQAYSDLADS